MKVALKKTPWVLARYRSCHVDLPDDENTPVMRSLRGNPKADTLMLVPPCSQVEYQTQIPFSTKTALAFHAVLAAEGIDTEKDFLIVSCSLFGLKANKASTTPMVEFLKECAGNEQFKKFVCVGDETFKFLFAHGRKASMQTLGGATLYVPLVNRKPLFVFPDIAGLAPDYGIDDEDWKRARWQQRTEKDFSLYARRFRTFCEL